MASGILLALFHQSAFPSRYEKPTGTSQRLVERLPGRSTASSENAPRVDAPKSTSSTSAPSPTGTAKPATEDLAKDNASDQVVQNNNKKDSTADAIPIPLSSIELRNVVSQYAPSIKQTCWQPALDSRTPDAPTTARVSVTIQIRPNGDVASVTSSGEAVGYSGLATCIKNRVRTWKFPRASGSSVVNVPFIFTVN